MSTRRSCRVFFLALSLSFAVRGADYRALTPGDKLAHPDLSFCVTFDGFTTRAEKAGGAYDSLTLPALDLGLRGIVGFDGKQGFQTSEGNLFYPVPGNISAERGSVTLWLKSPDSIPGGEVFFTFMAKNKNASLNFILREVGEPVYFEILPSAPGKGLNPPCAGRKSVKKGEWYQVAMTWTPEKSAVYLNGEPCGENPLPLYLSEQMKNFTVDPALSYFGVPRSRDRGVSTQIDDIKIYSRALSALEIKKQYQEPRAGAQAGDVDPFELKIGGAGGTVDALEADMDFHALPDKQMRELKRGALKISYMITGPEEFLKTGEWIVGGLTETRRINGVQKAGLYRIVCAALDGDRKTGDVKSEIYRPDLSFIGNSIGLSNNVPSPWTPLSMSGRAVSVWGREYRFGAGPFPESVTVNGKNLLLASPMLRITLPSGPAKISYSAEGESFTACGAELHGRGVFDKYSLEYKTSVAYDGMIKTDFVICGSPEISLMTLEWRVAPESSQYLMTPCLSAEDGGVFAASYPQNSNEPNMLWLTSEKNGGFAYAMENDANWRCPENYPVLRADRKTGECSVTMIAETVKLPGAASYNACFIATPTRPPAALKRNIHFGCEDLDRRYPGGIVRPLLFNDGKGLAEGIGSYKVQPGAFEKVTQRFADRSVGVYGMANALTSSIPLAGFFSKYYDIPQDYKYTFCYEMYDQKTGGFKKITTFSAPACNAAAGVNDYILSNIQETVNYPAGEKVWMIYYDLCGNTLCGNKFHGCAFADKFGRQIKTFTFLKKRALIERSVRLAHESGRVVCVHAQRAFSPFMHGLADYWHPGEQNNALLMRNLNCYTDDIPDAIWRSEYNHDVLGVNVIFLPADTKNLRWESVAEGMMSQILIHDIDVAAVCNLPVPLLRKVWSAPEKYGVDSDTPFHPYYEQKTVLSSNGSVRISYYKISENKYLFILANKTAHDAQTEADFSRLPIPDGAVLTEEFKGGEVTIVGGAAGVLVPARSFRLLGYIKRESAEKDGGGY